ncbi:MAG: M48 family metallopeptidase [Betaproteobacteria bacterium]|nr:M48 family metallopeptidase [Betaproteobacteria bacterium]
MNLFLSYLRRLVLAVCALSLIGCASVQTTQSGAVGIDRKQSMLVSSKEMDSAALQAYGETVGNAKKEGKLDQDPKQLERVQTVGLRLLPGVAVFREDALGWQWEVHVITSPEINAWCMPGGKVAVYTGLLEKIDPSDDELAAVLGHEIAHALREHSRERASEAMATSVGLSVLSAAVGLKGYQTDLAKVVTNLTVSLPNSREHETEADRIGVELAARAGYDPAAAITLWEKMGRASGSQPPQFLSTHPSNQSRLSDLRAYAEKVKPLYEEALRNPQQ